MSRKMHVLLGLALVMAALPAGSAADPAPPEPTITQAGVLPCDVASARVDRARRAVSSAKAKVRRARTAAAKRRARKRLAQAKAKLNAALADRRTACAPGAPGTPAPPSPPSPPPPVNRPPAFPDAVTSDARVDFEYDDAGRLKGVVVTINVSTPAVDPDGDPVTYSWSASTGTITGDGLTGTFRPPIVLGRPQTATVTLTASDGRGGTDAVTFNLR